MHGTLDHLLGLELLPAEQIVEILDQADKFKEINQRKIKKVPTLRGLTVINFFAENSTRTRMSFEIAGKRLSADTVNFSASGSSFAKGETLLDTAKNLAAMHPDIIILRHAMTGAPHFLAKHVDAAIVNAGDGAHEHPTQALLDMMTIREHKGRLKGLVVAIVGDITNSRVARSNIFGMTKLGVEVRVCGPATMLPIGIERLGVEVFHDIDRAVTGADVVMMLRIQKERTSDPLFPNDREYSRFFGLNARRLALAKQDVLVMHPGPMNRGVELASDVADGPWSVILEQVSNGVALRMAVLYLCAAQRLSE
ncbi:MAG: aspartate carbamoyltransferase catalytic subunit [Myxococcales bacterium]|nr:aspartate carbamoyltransferase catalytic subunit [Myxococcales bacterium]